MIKEFKQLEIPTKQFLLNSMFVSFGWTTLNLFFVVELYILSDSIGLVFLHQMIQLMVILPVITYASWAVQRLGYQPVYRLGHGIFAGLLVALAVLWPAVEAEPFKWFWLYSVATGISSGMYHAVHHYMVVRVLSGQQRQYVYNLTSAYSVLKGIVLPITIGALISFVFGFRWLFLIPAVVSLVAARGFYDRNQKPSRPSKLISRRFVSKLLAKQHSKHFLLIYVVDTIEDEFQRGFWSIAPFLIIGSVFGYGAFISGIALLGGLVAFWRRHTVLDDNLRLGYILQFSRVLATIGLVGWWQTTALTGRAIVEGGAKTLEQPIDNNLDSSLRERILGDDIENETIQLNYLLEIVKFVGRMISMAALLSFVYVLTDTELLIRVLWPIVALFGLLTYWLQVRLWKLIR